MPRKGKKIISWYITIVHLLTCFSLYFRFGWVNASYVYGLQIVNAHMRRALGTLTPYETFVKALEENRNKALAELE